jgi:hypothetical protein
MGSGIFAWICGGGNRVGNRTCQVSILSGLTNKSLDDGVRSSGVVMSTTWGLASISLTEHSRVVAAAGKIAST